MTDQRQWSRRRWLAAAGSTAAVGLAGCSSDDGTGGTEDDGSTPGGNSGNGDTSNPDGGTSEQSFEGPVTANGTCPQPWVDAGNTGVVDGYSGPPVPVKERWSETIQTDTDDEGTLPAVSEGTVYFGTADRVYYAYDLLSGEKQWEYEHGPQLTGLGVTLDQDGVYVAGGGLAALDPESGDVQWEAEKPGEPRYLRVEDGRLYAFPMVENTMYAYDTQSGDQVLEQSLDFAPSQPAVDGGTVYLKGANETIQALDGETGDVLWQESHGEALNNNGPTVSDGRVYYVVDGQLEARSADDGELLWTWNEETVARQPPTVAGDVVVPKLFNGAPIRIDAGSGETIGDFEDGGIARRPRVADGTVYFASIEDLDAPQRLYAADIDDGSTKWSTELPGGADHTPVVLEDLLVHVTGNSPYVLEPV